MTAYNGYVTCRSSSLGHPSVSGLLCYSAGRFRSAAVGRRRPRRTELAQRLDDDHLARRIEQAVARLDLTSLWQSYAGIGSLPCRPDLLLRAVLYEVQRGQHGPAVWQRDAREAEPVRWLLGLYPLAFLRVRLPGPRRPPSGRVARPSARTKRSPPA